MAQDLVPYEPEGDFVPGAKPFAAKKLLGALLRKWWILVLTTAIPTGGAVYYIRNKPVQYVSQATLWVRGKLRLAEVGQYTEDGQTFFGTQVDLLKSSQIQLRAMERVKAPPTSLEPPKDELGLPILPEIRVAQAAKSSVIVVDAFDPNPKYAQAFLGALVDEFMGLRKESRASASTDALTSASDLALKIESEMKGEQEKLAKFRRENNMALLEENLRGGGGQLANLNGQISVLKLELQLLNATAVEKSAGLGAETNGPVYHTNLVLAGASAAFPSIAGAQGEYGSAQQQLEVLKIQWQQLGRFLRPKHPKMVRLSDEIAKAEKVIEFYKTRSEQQMKAAQEANRIRLAGLEQAAKELAEKVGDANRRMAEYEQLRANIARQQVYYERLLSLLQGVNLNSNMNQEDLGILERASEARPPKSKAVLIVAGAAVFGLGLGMGIVFLLFHFDDRCESIVEIRAMFPEQVFGQLPDVSVKGSTNTIPVLQLNDDRHLLVESCRSLRSSLLFGLNSKEKPKLIVVTSAAPDEGKSTISINLATTLAQGGARVLLIDADVRRGHLHKTFETPGEPGLTECLRGKGALNLSDHVIETKIPGLSLLPRGKVCTLGELFLSAQFDRLLEQARQDYDYTILDSIPVFAADDSTTLAPKADGVLFVIRRAYTSAKLAQEALELLYQRNAKILGIVFNRADTQSRAYNYYKYSKYHEEVVAK